MSDTFDHVSFEQLLRDDSWIDLVDWDNIPFLAGQPETHLPSQGETLPDHQTDLTLANGNGIVRHVALATSRNSDFIPIMQPGLPISCAEPNQNAGAISADGGMHELLRGTQPNSKAESHHCTESGCTKSYLRRGDLTRHVREAHDLSSRFCCSIERCHANSPTSGFKRMHRLVEHLMSDFLRETYELETHPRLFNQADATWVAHDFNANRGGFQEIVFAASGAGIRMEAESAITAHRCRVPEKYVRLYFRVLCPVQECSHIAIPKLRWHRFWKTHRVELHDHLQKRHGYALIEAIEATRGLTAQAIEFAKAHPICGLDVGSSGYHH